MNLNQVTIPAVDMEESAEFYRRMGFLQIVDTPHYARFECPAGDSTFSLSLVEEAPQSSSAAIYFEHQSLDQLVESLGRKGFVFESPATDQSYLWREAVLRDPTGNKVILYWAGEARKNPPWRVELKD